MEVTIEGRTYNTALTEEQHAHFMGLITAVVTEPAQGDYDGLVGEVLKDCFDESVLPFEIEDTSNLHYDGQIVFPLNDAFDSDYGAYVQYTHNLDELFETTVFGGSVRILEKTDSDKPAFIFVSYGEDDFCHTYIFE